MEEGNLDDAKAELAAPDMVNAEQIPPVLNAAPPEVAPLPMLWKRSRLAQNLADLPSSQLAEAAAKIEQIRAENRRRCEKYGTPYVEPGVAAFVAAGVSKTDYLRLTRQTGAGEVSGVDPTSNDEKARREARAAKFGVQAFSYEDERARMAGLSADDMRLRKERRERASRFGVSDELDINMAKAAVAAIGTDPTYPDGQVPADRPTALHMCAYQYLPADSSDILAFFSPLKPSFIEWLNGNSCNVLFEDEGTANRALELTSEPVPVVQDVARVQPCWRVCLKEMVKQTTSKYAPAGAQTTVYLRVATTSDTRENAKKTYGPKTHGTYSKDGQFSLSKLGRIEKGGMDEDALVPQPDAAGAPAELEPYHVSGAVTGALRTMTSHVASALDAPLSDKAIRRAPILRAQAPVSAAAMDDVIVVKKTGQARALTTGQGHQSLARDPSRGPLQVVLRPKADAIQVQGYPAGMPGVVSKTRGRGRDGAAAAGIVPASARPSKKRGRAEYSAEQGMTVDEADMRARVEVEHGTNAEEARHDDDTARDEEALLARLDAEEAEAMAYAAASAESSGGRSHDDPAMFVATQQLAYTSGRAQVAEEDL